MTSETQVPVARLPHRKQNTVHIIQFELTASDETRRALQCLLDAQELTRAFRFKRRLHQSRFIVGRARLRTILSHYVGIPAEEIVFDYGPHGKPRCTAATSQGIGFNLSHTGDHGVCAITSDAEVGVDIEHRTARDVAALAKRYFHAAESAHMVACADDGDRLGLFYKYWTAKEALLKGAGGGLTLPLNRCRFDLEQEPPGLELIDLPAVARQGWNVRHFCVAPAVIGAVAVAGPIGALQQCVWEPVT